MISSLAKFTHHSGDWRFPLRKIILTLQAGTQQSATTRCGTYPGVGYRSTGMGGALGGYIDVTGGISRFAYCVPDF